MSNIFRLINVKRYKAAPFLTVGFSIYCCLFFATISFAQEPVRQNENGVLEPVTVKTDLYPANADANKEINDALKQAATDHKRIILIFGGNWCYDCHVLDQALHDGEAGKIVNESFILLHIDIGEADKNLELVKKYRIPLAKGVPAVAILESDGREIYSSGDGEFEAARRMMKKDLLAFLKLWRNTTKKPAG